MGKRERFLKKTKEKMKKTLRSRDMFLARMNRSIEELNDVVNVLVERLEDMFRLYFPGIEVLDREKYTQMVLLAKKDLDMKELSKLFGSSKANEIANKLKFEGVEEEDLLRCRELAEKISEMFELRDQFEKREEELCRVVCPNMALIAGPHLAAKLIAHVGTLERLAMQPASTIQVIGAEKALFKHLKNKNVRPPKHGLIFQHAKVSNSPKKVRGKIARTLAAKIATAAKADAFTKNDVSEKLIREFEQRYESIMKEYRENKKVKK